MNIVIEKGVPIPPDRRGGANRHASMSRWPWETLEIGDSFRVRSSGPNTTWANRRYAPKKFISRQIGGRLYRVWRVE